MKSQKIRNMVLRSSVIIAALLGLYFLKMTEPTVVVNDKEALILQGLMQTIEYVHFAPKKVDDAFSQTIYKTYLERIDGQKRFFTQQDIDKIKPFLCRLLKWSIGLFCSYNFVKTVPFLITL